MNTLIRRLALPFLLVAYLAACSSPGASAPPTVDVTGIWQGPLTAEGWGSDIGRFRLVQSGATVTGDFAGLDGYVFYRLGDVAGRVSGNPLSLTLTLDTTVTDPGGDTFSGRITGNRYEGSGSLWNDATGDRAEIRFSMTRR